MNKEEAIENLQEISIFLRRSKEDHDALEMAIEALRSQRQGSWQGVSPTVDTIECSICGYQLINDEFKTPYCPWCGAKMEDDEDEHTEMRYFTKEENEAIKQIYNETSTIVEGINFEVEVQENK